MRHVERKRLGRDTGSREELRRVFIASEGYRTEVGYFTRLVEDSERLGLYGRVEVIVLNRYPPDDGQSDPGRVYAMCRDHMRFLSGGECTEDLFRRMLADAAGGDRALVSEVLADGRFRPLMREGGLMDMERASELASELLYERGIEATPGIERVRYEPAEDDVYIVVDRDADVRPPEKFSRFLESCRSSGFVPIVSNPMFELWELMSLPDVSSEELEAISVSRNPAAAVRRAMERHGLRKDDPDFGRLVAGLDTAMANGRGYPRSAEDLVHRVGTNVPVIIDALRDERGSRHTE